jgi:hypothetical protein
MEEDKEVSVIYETFNWDKFKPMKQNRGTLTDTGTKQRKLVSILKLLETGKFVPELATIRVNMNFEIIDGHHRLQALKMYKLPVRYEIITDDKFNQATGREKLGHIYDVNAINPSWTQQDMYKAALAAKAPVALSIQAIITKYRNKFEFNHILALVMKDEKIFTGARKGSVSMQTFDNKKLIEEMESQEFTLEVKYFVELNEKLRISERSSIGYKAAYAIMWKYMGSKEPVVFRSAFRKAILTTSENMLRNSDRTRTLSTWVRLFIETYNRRNRDKIKVISVLKSLGKLS